MILVPASFRRKLSTVTLSVAAGGDIQAAITQAVARAPLGAANLVIQLAAGTYAGGVLLDELRLFDMVTISGPSVGGHPNVPTAIIDFDEDTDAEYGVAVQDGSCVTLENLLFTGAFPAAVRARRRARVDFTNVHVDGAVIGWDIQTDCIYFARGGIIENCSTFGVQELFGASRSFVADNLSEGTIFRGNVQGFLGKEHGHGHMNYLTWEDNGIAMELNSQSVANVGGAVFKRNGVGIALLNSEIHSNPTFGTGDDANDRDLVSLGASSELHGFGWSGDASAITTGHRALVPIASSLAPLSPHTGTTTATIVWSGSNAIKKGLYTTAGKQLRCVISGVVGTTLAAGADIHFRSAGDVLGIISLPISTPNGTTFRIEYDVLCVADGNNQLVVATLVASNGYATTTTATRTATLDDTDHTARVYIRVNDATDSVTLNSIVVLG